LALLNTFWLTNLSDSNTFGDVGLYSEITKSIRVSVKSTFLEDQSSPVDAHYVWAYEVRIENLGTEQVQLINRTWSITDTHGQTQTVQGAGVVGEQPILKPGGSFEYTSGTPLKTPSGMMVGTYEMEDLKGMKFDVKVPAFSLDSPHQPVRLN
jgi:ApaG protein